MILTFNTALSPSLSLRTTRGRRGLEQFIGDVSATFPGARLVLGCASDPSVLAASARDARQGGLVPALYCGPFGGVDVRRNPSYERYAQRDGRGHPIGWKHSRRSVMMCPASPYVELVLVPRLSERLGVVDAIFFDIPWILPGGCHCEWCREERAHGGGNATIVRAGLQRLCTGLRERGFSGRILVNASAPIVNADRDTGGHLSNLTGLFDEYVLEWSPHRMGQNPKILRRMFDAAKSLTDAPLHHAFRILSGDRLIDSSVLRSILSYGIRANAAPWFSGDLGPSGMRTLANVWYDCLGSYSTDV